MMMRKFIFSAILLLGFGTALTAAHDAPFSEAKWITKEQSRSCTNEWLGFRKHFGIHDVPSSVMANIAADTKYWLWVNGSIAVYEGGLKRGPSPGGTYYDSVDIAPYLHEGDNLIAILVWHMGKSGFSHIDSGISAMIFEAEGDGVSIVSDNSWECSVIHGYSTADVPEPNYRLPESSVRFDARKFSNEWYLGGSPEYLGRAMELPFAPGSAPFGELVARPIPLWKDYGIREYESVERIGDRLVCGLPYNCHVSPVLKVEAPEGRVITIETDHAVVTGSDCVRAQYVTREGVQEYEHFCWMNGEQVCYIIPSDVKVLGVGYRETGYDTEFTGRFVCDDPLLNEYAVKAQRTLFVCMRDTYYDCPDRERAQWWGDEVNELGESFYLLSPSSHKLALKGIYELINWQKPDGSLFAPVPASNWSNELPMQTLASVGWYGFHTYWKESGDDTFIADIYDGLHRYLHRTWQIDSLGLPVYRKGGWDWADAGDCCDAEALLGPWYYLALKAEREFALHLGRLEDASDIERMMCRMHTAYNEEFWTGTEYRSSGYDGLSDDRVQAMAVVSGLASPEKYDAILDILVSQSHATTYMHRYVLEALCMMNRADLAQDKMHSLYPTVMKPESSTLWEHWNFDGTSNHAWTGCGTIIMGKWFAGIKPVGDGFSTFSVEPMMGHLRHIEAAVDTVHGTISVRIDKDRRFLKMVLTVPEGTVAYVPGARGGIVEYGAGTHHIII